MIVYVAPYRSRETSKPSLKMCADMMKPANTDNRNRTARIFQIIPSTYHPAVSAKSKKVFR